MPRKRDQWPHISEIKTAEKVTVKYRCTFWGDKYYPSKQVKGITELGTKYKWTKGDCIDSNPLKQMWLEETDGTTSYRDRSNCDKRLIEHILLAKKYEGTEDKEKWSLCKSSPLLPQSTQYHRL